MVPCSPLPIPHALNSILPVLYSILRNSLLSIPYSLFHTLKSILPHSVFPTRNSLLPMSSSVLCFSTVCSCSLFPNLCSLFPNRYSLFPLPYSLLPIPCPTLYSIYLPYSKVHYGYFLLFTVLLLLLISSCLHQGIVDFCLFVYENRKNSHLGGGEGESESV